MSTPTNDLQIAARLNELDAELGDLLVKRDYHESLLNDHMGEYVEGGRGEKRWFKRLHELTSPFGWYSYRAGQVMDERAALVDELTADVVETVEGS